MPDRVLLDTDVFSYYYARRPEFERFRPLLSGKTLCLSFITLGELLYGAHRKSWGDRRISELQTVFRSLLIIPFSDDLPDQYGRLVADCETRGCPIMLNDAWIAATALSNGLLLATNNLRHFQPVNGLSILHPDLQQTEEEEE